MLIFTSLDLHSQSWLVVSAESRFLLGQESEGNERYWLCLGPPRLEGLFVLLMVCISMEHCVHRRLMLKGPEILILLPAK